MKQTRILFLMGILIFGLIGVSSLLHGDVTLAVPERFQEYSNWCWAGSSQAILYYFNQFPAQCEIANYAWSTTKCCTDSTNFYDRLKGCNKANYLYGTEGSIEGILANWGIPSTGMANSLTWTACVQELDDGDPFVIRFGWIPSGGHFLVGYGYVSSGSYLKYMDPWPGEGYTTSVYSWVVSASDHEWTHTLTTY